MTWQRLGLALMSALTAVYLGLSLWSSWTHPQQQSRLDLLQTDLVLQVSSLPLPQPLRIEYQSLFKQALSAYQRTRRSLTDANASAQLDLHIGLLQVQLGRVEEAIATWQKIQPVGSRAWLVGQILASLWGSPPRPLPDAERQIKAQLDHWYQAIALQQLYQVQQRPEMVSQLWQEQRAAAQHSLYRLLWVNAVPVFGGTVGVGVWLYWAVQAWRRKPSAPPEPWQVSWGLEQTWARMIIWFSAFVGISQVVIPALAGILHLHPPPSGQPDQYVLKAWWVLIPYLMAVAPALAIATWGLPQSWLRWQLLDWQWIRWGITGYFAAIPPVLLLSLLSQYLLRGQGGGNPLLPILVASHSPVAQAILWCTVGIAAPFFEELLFRGFLLPSLASALPLPWAIALSSCGFALMHFNLSDLLPLTALGVFLGYIYWRSRNLLAPILLHSLWNSGSFLALVSLGQS